MPRKKENDDDIVILTIRMPRWLHRRVKASTRVYGMNRVLVQMIAANFPEQPKPKPQPKVKWTER